MYCIKCGKGNVDDAQFCLHCGEKIPMGSTSSAQGRPNAEIQATLSTYKKVTDHALTCSQCGHYGQMGRGSFTALGWFVILGTGFFFVVLAFGSLAAIMTRASFAETSEVLAWAVLLGWFLKWIYGKDQIREFSCPACKQVFSPPSPSKAS